MSAPLPNSLILPPLLHPSSSPLPSLTPPPLPQVGTKERKVAPYGGSFSNKGDKAYLTRPGLRVWTADRNGKVSFVLRLMSDDELYHARFASRLTHRCYAQQSSVMPYLPPTFPPSPPEPGPLPRLAWSFLIAGSSPSSTHGWTSSSSPSITTFYGYWTVRILKWQVC